MRTLQSYIKEQLKEKLRRSDLVRLINSCDKLVGKELKGNLLGKDIDKCRDLMGKIYDILVIVYRAIKAANKSVTNKKSDYYIETPESPNYRFLTVKDNILTIKETSTIFGMKDSKYLKISIDDILNFFNNTDEAIEKYKEKLK